MSGQFDDETFGLGYGEENDFCLRAVERGWRHLLACDTYVFHEGNVSFGVGGRAGKKQRALDVAGCALSRLCRDGRAACLAAMPPARALRADRGAAARVGPATVLMISHQLGGGVQRHIGGTGRAARRALRMC